MHHRNQWKVLSFRRAVTILILTVLILQFLVGKLMFVAVFNKNFQQEKQQLLGFSSPKEERNQILRLPKKHPSNPYKDAISGPVSFFDEEENATQQCWLSSITGQLGCGIDGHGFNATMHCHQKNGATTDITHHNVVFKVPLVIRDHSYHSESEKVLKRFAEYHKILLSNTSTTSKDERNMREYFHLPFGTVSVSPLRLWEVIANGSRCDDIRKWNVTEELYWLGPSPPPVLGPVMYYAGAQPLRPGKLMTPDEQRRSVKDLVCIYQHMYKRKFVHLDIQYNHFLYDGEHTSLIDFNQARALLPGKKEDIAKTQKSQLFQLMDLIKRVCTKEDDKVKNKMVGLRIIRDINLAAEPPLAQNWTLALEQCDFVNQPITPILFGKNITTEQTYEMLSQWTGGCST